MNRISFFFFFSSFDTSIGRYITHKKMEKVSILRKTPVTIRPQ